MKKDLSERDICTKFITPALTAVGWDLHTQIREEVTFTKGRIIVRGKLHTRSETKRADHILYYRPNIPLALIEAKDPTHTVGAGMPAEVTTTITGRPASLQIDAAQVLTMHASKGLEFHTVAIPDLGCMPYPKVPEEEEGRVLYVAMTRATHTLLLSHHSQSRFTEKLMAELSPNASPPGCRMTGLAT